MNKYYAILGLPPNASKDEVRRKYRRLVLQWHPDRNPSPEAQGKFIQITEAYDILMGERAAPRTRSYTRSTYGHAQTKPKTRQEQERERRTQNFEMLRRKFENVRQAHLRAPNYLEKKQSSYVRVTAYFSLAALVFITGLVLPFTVFSPASIIITFPLGLGFGLRWFWIGGRTKMRADMIYSGKHYSGEDILEFFRTRSGEYDFFHGVDGD